MARTHSTRNVVVIGAGPGGLAASILLAKAGVKVTVLERLPRVGGRTSTMAVNGFKFDTGPTFFHYPRILSEILASAGYDIHRELKLVELDPQYRLVFGQGGEMLAMPDVRRVEQAIAKLCPADAQHVRRYLADTRRKLTAFEPFLAQAFSGWRDLAKPDMARLLPILKPWKSLDEELKTYFSDPRVRIGFSFQSKYLGMSPFQCPSLFTILSFLEYEYGVYHPVGGCGAVTTAMARVARELGVDIRLNEPVESLSFRGRRLTGVRTARGDYRPDSMVINADFARAMQRLVPDELRPNWSDRKIAGKRMSCSTFMLYLGVRGVYDKVSHHTIYISKDYPRNVEEIGEKHVLSADPPFYVQNACVTDSTLAPAGMSTIYVLVPVTHRHPNVDWSKERDRYRALALKKLAQIGIEDIESRIVFEKVVTPDDWDHEFELHQGSTFGLAHIWSQMLHLRPRNRFDELEGVYLVGGSTHPGSGLPVIFESARISARLLLEDAGIPLNWNTPAAARDFAEMIPGAA
ncbi:MAG: phytoene desaturase [Proteobacteria bacterium]|nr:phytoene desaturase [Pseudomonadota bacterium]